MGEEEALVKHVHSSSSSSTVLYSSSLLFALWRNKKAEMECSRRWVGRRGGMRGESKTHLLGGGGRGDALVSLRQRGSSLGGSLQRGKYDLEHRWKKSAQILFWAECTFGGYSNFF